MCDVGLVQCSEFYFQHFHVLCCSGVSFPDFLFEKDVLLINRGYLCPTSGLDDLMLSTQVSVLCFPGLQKGHELPMLALKQSPQLVPTLLARIS